MCVWCVNERPFSHKHVVTCQKGACFDKHIISARMCVCSWVERHNLDNSQGSTYPIGADLQNGTFQAIIKASLAELGVS